MLLLLVHRQYRQVMEQRGDAIQMEPSQPSPAYPPAHYAERRKSSLPLCRA